MAISKKEAVARKVRALLAKTEEAGCTEQEVLSAAELASQLMTEYELDMTELELVADEFVEEPVRVWYQTAHPKSRIAMAVAKLFDCKVWSTKRMVGDKYLPHLVFFGRPSDVKLAAHFYVYLQRAVDDGIKVFTKTPEYKDVNSKKYTGRHSAMMEFQGGMCNRISMRLYDMAESRKTASGEQSTALVVLKEKLVQDALDKKDLNLKALRRPAGGHDNAAYAAGVVAGNAVQIVTPIANA